VRPRDTTKDIVLTCMGHRKNPQSKISLKCNSSSACGVRIVATPLEAP
jgi:hypothetical protein